MDQNEIIKRFNSIESSIKEINSFNSFLLKQIACMNNTKEEAIIESYKLYRNTKEKSQAINDNGIREKTDNLKHTISMKLTINSNNTDKAIKESKIIEYHEDNNQNLSSKEDKPDKVDTEEILQIDPLYKINLNMTNSHTCAYSRIGYMTICSSVATTLQFKKKKNTPENMDDFNMENTKSALFGAADDALHFYNYLMEKGQGFINQGKFEFSTESVNSQSKENFLIALNNFFNSATNDACIIYYSGHGLADSKLLFETSQECYFIHYDEIVSLWKNRTNPLKNKHLLLVLDCCYSGSWVQQMLKNGDYFDLSIQASSTLFQKSNDLGMKKGSLYSTLYLLTNKAVQIGDAIDFNSDALKKKLLLQYPVSFGLREFTHYSIGLEHNMLINSWQELLAKGVKTKVMLDAEKDLAFRLTTVTNLRENVMFSVFKHVVIIIKENFVSCFAEFGSNEKSLNIRLDYNNKNKDIKGYQAYLDRLRQMNRNKLMNQNNKNDIDEITKINILKKEVNNENTLEVEDDSDNMILDNTTKAKDKNFDKINEKYQVSFTMNDESITKLQTGSICLFNDEEIFGGRYFNTSLNKTHTFMIEDFMAEKAVMILASIRNLESSYFDEKEKLELKKKYIEESSNVNINATTNTNNLKYVQDDMLLLKKTAKNQIKKLIQELVLSLTAIDKNRLLTSNTQGNDKNNIDNNDDNVDMYEEENELMEFEMLTKQVKTSINSLSLQGSLTSSHMNELFKFFRSLECSVSDFELKHLPELDSLKSAPTNIIFNNVEALNAFSKKDSSSVSRLDINLFRNLNSISYLKSLKITIDTININYLTSLKAFINNSKCMEINIKFDTSILQEVKVLSLKNNIFPFRLLYTIRKLQKIEFVNIIDSWIGDIINTLEISELQSFVLNNSNIDKEKIELFSSLLADHDNLKTLKLVKCGLTDIPTFGAFLTNIDFSSNRISNINLKLLLSLLSKLKFKYSINLSDNCISNQSLNTLSSYLKKNNSCLEFNLSKNLYNQEFLNNIISSLTYNNTLQTLNISHIEIDQPKVIRDLLKNQKTLRNLIAKSCRLVDASFETIMQIFIFSNSNLISYADFSDNKITNPIYIDKISKIIKFNKRLKYLNLEGCVDITDCEDLIKAAQTVDNKNNEDTALDIKQIYNDIANKYSINFFFESSNQIELNISNWKAPYTFIIKTRGIKSEFFEGIHIRNTDVRLLGNDPSSKTEVYFDFEVKNISCDYSQISLFSNLSKLEYLDMSFNKKSGYESLSMINKILMKGSLKTFKCSWVKENEGAIYEIIKGFSSNNNNQSAALIKYENSSYLNKENYEIENNDAENKYQNDNISIKDVSIENIVITDTDYDSIEYLKNERKDKKDKVNIYYSIDKYVDSSNDADTTQKCFNGKENDRIVIKEFKFNNQCLLDLENDYTNIKYSNCKINEERFINEDSGDNEDKEEVNAKLILLENDIKDNNTEDYSNLFSKETAVNQYPYLMSMSLLKHIKQHEEENNQKNDDDANNEYTKAILPHFSIITNLLQMIPDNTTHLKLTSNYFSSETFIKFPMKHLLHLELNTIYLKDFLTKLTPLIKSNKPRLTTLAFINSEFNKPELIELEKISLQISETLTSIHFIKCSISSNELTLLFKSLSILTKLELLNISENYIDDVFSTYLSDFLESNLSNFKNFHSLILKHSNLTRKKINLILRPIHKHCLHNNTKLKLLDISGLRISKEPNYKNFKEFGFPNTYSIIVNYNTRFLLSKNKFINSLVEVYLNRVDLELIKEQLYQFFNNRVTLKFLTLDNCYRENNAIKLLSLLIKNIHISHLSLKNTNINRVSVKYLKEIINRINNLFKNGLISLNLTNCQLDDKTFSILSPALRNIKLKTIVLKNNMLTSFSLLNLIAEVKLKENKNQQVIIGQSFSGEMSDEKNRKIFVFENSFRVFDSQVLKSFKLNEEVDLVKAKLVKRYCDNRKCICCYSLRNHYSLNNTEESDNIDIRRFVNDKNSNYYYNSLCSNDTTSEINFFDLVIDINLKGYHLDCLNKLLKESNSKDLASLSKMFNQTSTNLSTTISDDSNDINYTSSTNTNSNNKDAFNKYHIYGVNTLFNDLKLSVLCVLYIEENSIILSDSEGSLARWNLDLKMRDIIYDVSFYPATNLFRINSFSFASVSKNFTEIKTWDIKKKILYRAINLETNSIIRTPFFEAVSFDNVYWDEHENNANEDNKKSDNNGESNLIKEKSNYYNNNNGENGEFNNHDHKNIMNNDVYLEYASNDYIISSTGNNDTLYLFKALDIVKSAIQSNKPKNILVSGVLNQISTKLNNNEEKANQANILNDLLALSNITTPDIVINLNKKQKEEFSLVTSMDIHLNYLLFGFLSGSLKLFTYNTSNWNTDWNCVEELYGIDTTEIKVVKVSNGMFLALKTNQLMIGNLFTLQVWKTITVNEDSYLYINKSLFNLNNNIYSNMIVLLSNIGEFEIYNLSAKIKGLNNIRISNSTIHTNNKSDDNNSNTNTKSNDISVISSIEFHKLDLITKFDTSLNLYSNIQKINDLNFIVSGHKKEPMRIDMRSSSYYNKIKRSISKDNYYYNEDNIVNNEVRIKHLSNFLKTVDSREVKQVFLFNLYNSNNNNSKHKEIKAVPQDEFVIGKNTSITLYPQLSKEYLDLLKERNNGKKFNPESDLIYSSGVEKEKRMLINDGYNLILSNSSHVIGTYKLYSLTNSENGNVKEKDQKIINKNIWKLNNTSILYQDKNTIKLLNLITFKNSVIYNELEGVIQKIEILSSHIISLALLNSDKSISIIVLDYSNNYTKINNIREGNSNNNSQITPLTTSSYNKIKRKNIKFNKPIINIVALNTFSLAIKTKDSIVVWDIFNSTPLIDLQYLNSIKNNTSFSTTSDLISINDNCLANIESNFVIVYNAKNGTVVSSIEEDYDVFEIFKLSEDFIISKNFKEIKIMSVSHGIVIKTIGLYDDLIDSLENSCFAIDYSENKYVLVVIEKDVKINRFIFEGKLIA